MNYLLRPYKFSVCNNDKSNGLEVRKRIIPGLELFHVDAYDPQSISSFISFRFYLKFIQFSLTVAIQI